MTSRLKNPLWQLQSSTDLNLSHSNDKASIAFNLAREAWPKIVSDIIENLETTLSSIDGQTTIRLEGDAILDDLQQLRSAITQDQVLPPLPDDGGEDINDYNAELATLQPVSWHNSPWMFTECHLFRYVRACFARRSTEYWQNYDVWADQKLASIKTSGLAISELMDWFFSLDPEPFDLETGITVSPTTRKPALEDLLQVSLWGNTADLLSLLPTLSEELHSRQDTRARKQLKHNVLVDDTNQVIALLELLRSSTRRDRSVHVVLDNAGFELISDLILVAYLLCAGFTDTVVLHGKQFPWYVSDATRMDFDHALASLSSPSDVFPDHDGNGFGSLPVFSCLIKTLLYSQPARLVFTSDPFWTTAHPFARLPDVAHSLYGTLRDADLVIFKGDLNYRKLVAGGRWPAETPFEVAIGPLRDMGLRVLALRTCKGDTCVGLRKGQAEVIDPEGKNEWVRNGKFGVVSFFDGKHEKT